MKLPLGVLFFCQLALQAVNGQTELISRLAVEIPEAELNLLNLRVSATAEGSRWNSNTGSWEYAGESEVTAYYEKDRSRIDFHKQVAPWRDGAAQYFEKSYMIAFNGQLSQKLYKTGGPPGNQHEDLRGVLDSTRDPNFVFGNWVSGWAFSLYGCWNQHGKRWSDVFRSGQFSLAARETALRSKSCIQLTAADTQFRHTWWLDSARGYAILAYEKSLSQPPSALLIRLSIDEITEASPGIYYPSRAVGEWFGPNGVPITRSSYAAKNIVANDPQFSGDIFTIRWPKGAIIEDKIEGRIITVGDDDEALRQRIERQVGEAKANLSREAEDTRADRKLEETLPPRFLWVTGISLLVVGGVVAALFWRRRK